MSSCSKKGTHIYFSFLSKSPGKRTPSMFPNGTAMERDTLLQGFFTYLLVYLYFLKAIRKERFSMFPKSGKIMETDAYSRALLNNSFGVPIKGALPPGRLRGVPSERDVPFLEPSFIIQSPRYTRPPSCSRFPSNVKGHLWRDMPVSGAFLNISSRVPSKGALPRGPPH
jgi:hypothetical protein